MTYQLTAGDDKAEVRAKLLDALAAAIKQCIGDTEEDRSRRTSRIHRVLSELWLFGTEIDEWYSIRSLPEVIQNQLTAVQELPDLMRKNSYKDDALHRVYYMIESLKSATTLTLNEEGWPQIKRHISSAANTIWLITHFYPFQIDPNYHNELVKRVTAMPIELDEHLARLQKDQFHRPDLEQLAHGLRMIAFKPLVPQHPQFEAGLKEISLDLRRYVLRWAKDAPKKDEAIDAVQDIRDRLTQLIDKYVSL